MIIHSKKQSKRNKFLNRYAFFGLMLLCMILASIKPNIGGHRGLIRGNLLLWYLVVPLTYLEAGLSCTPRSLTSVVTNGYLMVFVMLFVYVLMPILAKVGSFFLSYLDVNVWLLKGMEVLYCMPPPFSTSIALSKLAHADIPTSVVTTLVTHFAGIFFLSPILIYFMLGSSTPPLVGINIQEVVSGTVLPLAIGMMLRTIIVDKPKIKKFIESGWTSKAMLLLMAYNWFCDAVTADTTTNLQAMDILLCVFIACFGQLFLALLCWIFCCRWLSRPVFLAALFTSTHKSVGLGGWLLRGAYHGSIQGPAVNLPLSVLPVAQLLLGSLLAAFLKQPP